LPAVGQLAGPSQHTGASQSTRPSQPTGVGQAAAAGRPAASTGQAAAIPSHSQAPIRLRDPLPVRSTAFERTGGGGSWWIPAVLGLLALGVIVAVVVIALTRGSDGGGTPGPSTEPTINVPSGSRTLPTDVPTVTSPR